MHFSPPSSSFALKRLLPLPLPSFSPFIMTDTSSHAFYSMLEPICIASTTTVDEGHAGVRCVVIAPSSTVDVTVAPFYW